jgi:hypothetical protein
MRAYVKLRNAHLAVVDRGKVVDYLLNEAHPDNGGKARFFTLLGFSRQDPEGLMQALRDVAEHGEVVHSENRCMARNMLLTAGCRCTLKRAVGGQSGRYGSSTGAGMCRGL